MIRHPSRSAPGFTLLELMIATSLGLTVVLVAALGYRAAAAAMSAAQRLARENTAINHGLSAAFDELDQWRFYDDPSAPLGDPRKSLRRIGAVGPGDNIEYQPPIPSVGGEANPPSGGASFVFGLPFSKLSDVWGPAIPTQNFGGTGVGIPWLIDDNAQEKAWAISASNPLSCWNANLNSSYGRQSFMRRGYNSLNGVSGSSSNPRQVSVTIGAGFKTLDTMVTSPVDFIKYGSITIPQSVDPMNDMKNNRVHLTGSWLFNQMHGLDFALGYYGLLDYLPAGIPPSYPIGNTTSAATNFDVHSPMGVDGEGFPIFSTYGFYAIGGNTYTTSHNTRRNIHTGVTVGSHDYDFITTNYRFFNFALSQNTHATFPMLPSRNMLLNPGGFSVIPWCNEWDQIGVSLLGATVPVSTAAAPALNSIFYHRSYMVCGDNNDSNFEADVNVKTSYYYEPSLIGPLVGYTTNPIITGPWATLYTVIGRSPGNLSQADNQYFSKYLRRITGTMRLMPTRPADWPDMQVSVLRQLRQNRFVNLSNVSWFDPVSAKKYDLRFTAMGTTLRGARRQRSLDQ